MREFLLAAESGAAAGLSGWDLALQYIIYGAVIVLSIVILILIRKRTRLPRHAEIKARLDKLLEQAQSLSGPAENRMDFIKRVSRTLYLTDDLAYVTALVSSKERYSDIGNISTLLEQARAELAPYKYGKKESDDPDGISAAAGKIAQAVKVMQNVLDRDRDMKK